MVVTNLATLLQLGLEEMVEAIDRALNSAGYGEIKPSHGVVFENIRPGGSRLSEMAARAGMSKQLMQYLVNPLVEAGYLERQPDPSDKRGKLLLLTSKGKRAVRIAEEAIASTEREWASRHDPEQMAAVRNVLERIAQARTANA